MKNLFNLDPLVITALHIPEPAPCNQPRSMNWLEDFVLTNLSIFAEGGVPAVILQDESLTTGPAQAEHIAIMAALGRQACREFPDLHLGVIFQAHDPFAPIAVANASGASFVRIKVFIGAMLKAEGIQNGCGIDAREYRSKLGRQDIQILADVHDRTGYSLVNVPIETASGWAVNAGADGLILTGHTYQESLHYLKTVRQAGFDRPLLMGGGVSLDTVTEVLKLAEGVIVSSALKCEHADPDDLIRWDKGKVQRFMDAARQAVLQAK